jgi:anthranilate phosphoribosyltransferase
MMQVGIADYLKDIGRGHAGARALSADRAQSLFEAIFSGQLSDLALGATLMALRMKGETVAEVRGALHALAKHVTAIPVQADRPVVAIPSYNGARNTANLTPLLACLLADRGVQVVVHGVRFDPKRTTSHQIFRAMGIAPLRYPEEASDFIARSDPVFVPVDVLAPALARLLDMRWTLGVRNIGHTLAKLLNPCSSPRCLQLVSFTHPEFDQLQHQLLLEENASALVMRGTEGEVVANTRRRARVDSLHAGVCTTLWETDSIASGDAPSLPPAHDAMATAQWTRSVLAGERPVPEAIATQVDAIFTGLQNIWPMRATAGVTVTL